MKNKIEITEFKSYPIKNLLKYRKLKFDMPSFLKGNPAEIYFEIYNLLDQKMVTIKTYTKKELQIGHIKLSSKPKIPGLKPNFVDLDNEPEVKLKVCSNNKKMDVDIHFYYIVE